MLSLPLRSFLLSCAIFTLLPVAAENTFSPEQIASIHGLPSSTSLPFPTQTLDSNNTVNYLRSWDLTKHGDVAGKADVSFVQDPFQSNNTDPVFSVLYPAGSYSGSGGTVFDTYYNDSSSTGFRTMQISYQVAFQPQFQWVEGGKLPGLRGGSMTGCDGEENSETCFSTRFMWRTNGAGEVYAYVQGEDRLCNKPKVKCEDNNSASIGPGSFSFTAGEWNRLDMVVGLNNPVTTSNGYITAYYNGAPAINFTGLQIRSDPSVQNIQGMFFASFFGGNNSTWASPTDQHAYFKNIQMFGSHDTSNLPSSASLTRSSTSAMILVFVAIASIITTHQ